jgi:hypothetical protein
VINLVALAAVLVLAQVSSAASPASDEWDARVTAVSGSVVLLDGADAEGAPLSSELPLQEGDKLKTGPDGSVELSLDGTSVVKIGPDSEFKLSNLHRDQTLFDLGAGVYLSRIQKLLPTQSLQVRTSVAIAQVRGTDFGVESAGDETHVSVFDDGKVEVKAGGGSETLIGNQETIAKRGEKPAPSYVLQRLMRYRSSVRGFKKRLSAIKKDWKPLSAEERKAKRKDLLAKAREKRKEAASKAKEKQSGAKRETDRGKKEREKMERVREEIRRRRGAQ